VVAEQGEVEIEWQLDPSMTQLIGFKVQITAHGIQGGDHFELPDIFHLVHISRVEDQIDIAEDCQQLCRQSL
jgi:hypothetical protein